MFSFDNPVWFLLLLIIPLLRWLHQFRQQPGSILSTTLFLWRKIQHSSANNGIKTTPDPQWFLRALIAVLIILSLAEPSIQKKERHTIDVWVDDSLSMYTLENNQSRIQLAVQQLNHYLIENKLSKVKLHSLGNPASTLTLDPVKQTDWMLQISKWSAKPQGEPSLPPTATLSSEHDHILLTDGADTHLNQWAKSVPLRHLIQTGQAKQNIALTQLSIRRPLSSTGEVIGLVTINNLSDSQQKIHFKLRQDQQIIKAQDVVIPSSGEVILPFSLKTEIKENLLASIESLNDTLALDNELQLIPDTQSSLINYHTVGQCSQYVIAVLTSQPSLLQATNAADIIINCSKHIIITSIPTLRLHPSDSIQQTQKTAHWHTEHPSLNVLHMPSGLPYNASAPLLTSNNTPLLSADNHQLITFPGEQPQLIDCYLDTHDPFWSHQAEFPLMLLGLIEQLTGHKADTHPVSVSRNIAASIIKAIPLSIIPFMHNKSQSVTKNLSHWLVFIAILLLILDAALTFGLFQRLRRVYE